MLNRAIHYVIIASLAVMLSGCATSSQPPTAAAAAAARPQPVKSWTNSLGMEFVLMAPGTFIMGSEQGETNEKPAHQVTLTAAFRMGKYEVTQSQYQAVIGTNPSQFKGENLPVETVSWDDAVAFCTQLTERERAAGQLPAGAVYRLPTEAEWEYACRAGAVGEDAGNLDDMGWYVKNSAGTTHPVGQKKANAWGLYDMHGNVSEWCQNNFDCYPTGAVTDPVGADRSPTRVHRGGGWLYAATFARSAFRNSYTPGSRYTDLGFRVVLSPAGQ